MKLHQRIAHTITRALSKYVPDQVWLPEGKQPKPGVFYSGVRDDYSVQTDFRQLTPEKLGNAMVGAEEGDTTRQYEIFELVEQDAHVASVWGKRRQAVTSRSVVISPAYDDQRAEQASEICNELIFGKYGEGGIRNINDAIWDLTDAIGKGFALGQLVWKLDGGRWTVDKILRWPQSRCILGDPTKTFGQDEDIVRIEAQENQVSGILQEPYQWIQHTHKAWSVPLARAGLFRSITWWYLFKHFSAKDWMIFLERYGMPLRIGKYGPGQDQNRSELWNAVKDLGKDAACIMPATMDIELIEQKISGKGGSVPHEAMIDKADAQISKVFLGNPMTTDPGTRGARSLGEVYERNEYIMTDNDCEKIAKTLREQLCRPLIHFNLGPDFPIPKVELISNQESNLLEEAKLDDMLVNRLKLKLGKQYLHDKYDRPVPEEGEDVVEASAPPTELGEEEEQFVEQVMRMAQKKSSRNWVISKMRSLAGLKDQ